jgi:hypothetical protein
MTGAGWRLLAAFLLILVATLLRGQDAGDRIPALTPNAGPWSYGGPGAPILPERGPFGRWPIGTYPLGPYRLDPDPIGRDPVGRYPVGRDPGFPHPIVFPQIVQTAGIIFSGRVISIARHPSSKGAVSTAVTFKVERAMRGTSAGQSLTIHEWAGLWSRGERYRVGERVLLFLYSPSKLGLTSPVGGAVGKFAVKSDGQVVMNPQHVQILEPDPILGGKTVVPYADFSLAVQRSSRDD